MTALTATLKRTALATLAILGGVGSANAGIIVTIGRPSPELLRKILMTPHGNQGANSGVGGGYCLDQIFCVDLPIINKQICTTAVTLDDEKEVPPDWSCLELADAIYYCETEDEVGGYLEEESLTEFLVQPALEAEDEDEDLPPLMGLPVSTIDKPEVSSPGAVGNGADAGGAISYEGEVAQACQSGSVGSLGILAGLGLLAWRRRR